MKDTKSLHNNQDLKQDQHAKHDTRTVHLLHDSLLNSITSLLQKMKRIRLVFNKSTLSSKMVSKPNANSTSYAKRDEIEMDGDLFSRTAAAPMTSTSMTLSKRKLRPSSSIHPNLRSMCIRNSSRSLSRTASDSSPLSFIEEPLCAYLSLFDGTKKDMTDVHIHIIDNLFSDNFVHMMDGDAPIDKQSFTEIIKQMLKQGVVATLEDINFVDEYNLEYTVHWYYKENSSRVTHVSALVADQKIIKLEPCVETRSAFANNMTFPSWRNAKDENDQIRIGGSSSNKWLGDLLPRRSSSSDSTISSIEHSSLLNTAILPGKVIAGENKLVNLESTFNTTLQDNKTCECESKSTISSMMDEELLLVKSAESVTVHDDEQDSTESGRLYWIGVNQNEEERRIKRGNTRSSEQLKVKKGRWFRGRRKKK